MQVFSQGERKSLTDTVMSLTDIPNKQILCCISNKTLFSRLCCCCLYKQKTEKHYIIIPAGFGLAYWQIQDTAVHIAKKAILIYWRKSKCFHCFHNSIIMKKLLYYTLCVFQLTKYRNYGLKKIKF